MRELMRRMSFSDRVGGGGGGDGGGGGAAAAVKRGLMRRLSFSDRRQELINPLLLTAISARLIDELIEQIKQMR
ncbi:Os06g0671600 [Oryza sativa Japonica Group]|uniref:Os06g0671600 protein n=3 Tax=Oryza sativa TaxID=4530 RepID=B9FQF9_ORYSJ|nr:hypothetical protein OsI_24072 [Oryza sativa Indica Group]EEE66201.1 hypothetical protein OsJ_22327 [Oryza sativa Japonica Group]KAB8103496.1 hypothetical protein EE612_035975 [Oryza sativa]BAD46001.1 unknown protein [Oryza sativa Japonica Group]BAD46278.1 unknown protein [Oryza sativa Japonica Group]|eukprot:NP_001174951.1 Os06g0671600 [Oryza sativa Japonica Group]